MASKLKVLISGGGTGGHIFPALSIAGAVKRRFPEAEVLFVGALGRMEMQRVPAAGYRIVGLPVAGFDRKKLWRNFAVLAKLWKSLRIARGVLAEFQPDIAIGVGGYASGPMLKQAQKKGIPTLLQEQNSYAGVTNKLLAKKAGCICVAYDGMERFFPADKIVLTGNPIRKNLGQLIMSQDEAKKHLGFDPEKKLIVVVGGSLGARTVNRAVHEMLSQGLPENTQILWQTGKYYYPEYKDEQDEAQGIRVTEFINEMDAAYAAADLVVARAGAGTISELQNLGKPSILIPSPNVAEDHQRKNAQALESHQAAVMILDAEAVLKLPKAVQDLISNDESRKQLGGNAAKMALPDADEKIVDQIEKLLNKQL